MQFQWPNQRLPLASESFGEQAAEIICAIPKQSLSGFTRRTSSSRVSAMCWVIFGPVKRMAICLFGTMNVDSGVWGLGLPWTMEVVAAYCRLLMTNFIQAASPVNWNGLKLKRKLKTNFIQAASPVNWNGLKLKRKFQIDCCLLPRELSFFLLYEHKVDTWPLYVEFVMSDCREMIGFGWVWRLTMAWVYMCNTSLGCASVQVWNTGMIDEHGEG
jgi:hypothetical protein